MYKNLENYCKNRNKKLNTLSNALFKKKNTTSQCKITKLNIIKY